MVLEERIAVYSVSPDFSSVHLERSVETFPNPEGVCAISRYRPTKESGGTSWYLARVLDVR